MGSNIFKIVFLKKSKMIAMIAMIASKCRVNVNCDSRSRKKIVSTILSCDNEK